ncbi:plasmid pRiA4b ORF-3 family protein [Pseudalkalibacillus hwajinpoensis]|uniref:plasmid pRiA4b ORF-3 family protein n=1 Tax=Guptibacillus hwajinpoensis TaxID=208199 RepID=UPI00325B6C88
MIYQIKVSLMDMKPPIWRRLELDSSATFQELHDYIQIVFGWTNSHLHQFMVKQPELVEELVTQHQYEESVPVLTIGPKLGENFSFGPEPLDEREVKLLDVLKHEQDCFSYVYDFGEHWNHEILLEKILTEDSSVTYPRCTKAMKAAPEEDNRAFFEPGQKLRVREMKLINEELTVFSGESVAESIPFSDDPWEELFQLTLGYKKLQPWDWMHSSQMFIVEIPETGELAYCAVRGMSGQEFGLGVHVGNDGLAYSIAVIEGETDPETMLEYQRSLMLSFSDREELDSFDLKAIRNQGLRFRGAKEWPMFRSLSPGYFPWHFSDQEARIFCGILRQAIIVAEKARKDPDYLLEGYDGSWTSRFCEKGKWTTGVMEAAVEPDVEEPLHTSEIELRRVQKYRQVKMRVEFASFFEDEAVQERVGDRPFFPNVVLGVEDEGALIIYYKVFERTDYGSQLQASLVELLDKLTFLPTEVSVDSERVALKIHALTSKLGIRVSLVDQLLNVEEARRNIGW